MHTAKQRKFTELVTTHIEVELKDYVSCSKNFDREKYSLYTLQTKAGKLLITVRHENSAVFTVFTRFENALNGRELTHHSNPYSGKWNHHYSVNGISPENAAKLITNSLSWVCGYKPQNK
ncbi:MAG: hypothetical protein GY714_01905 [Desulfobacterales bacterium]|nr:hypothetical protein [Desulfobacterales bacterium]